MSLGLAITNNIMFRFAVVACILATSAFAYENKTLEISEGDGRSAIVTAAMALYNNRGSEHYTEGEVFIVGMIVSTRIPFHASPPPPSAAHYMF